MALSPEESRERSNEGHPRLQHHHCPPPSSDWQIASIALPTLHPKEPPLPFRQINSDFLPYRARPPAATRPATDCPAAAQWGFPCASLILSSFAILPRLHAPRRLPSAPPTPPTSAQPAPNVLEAADMRITSNRHDDRTQDATRRLYVACRTDLRLWLPGLTNSRRRRAGRPLRPLHHQPPQGGSLIGGPYLLPS